MRQAFVRLGFSQQGAVAVVDDQGIDTVDELGVLTDDEIETLCKTIRRPGGTIVNAAGANIPNPGTNISLRAETNMKLAAYWVRYRKKTSRATTPANIMLADVRDIRGLRDWQLHHTALEASDTIIDMKNWPKTVDAIKEYLRGNLGVTGIPLAYVVRENEAVADDPPDGWTTRQEEMIMRAPINNAAGDARTPTFVTDNQRVWDLLSEITRSKECWTYAKTGQRNRDGRVAYLALYNHYLGPNSVDNMANAVERKLMNTTYDGEKKRWNLEKYTTVHTEQHHIARGLRRHGYTGIDPRSEVRYFVDGIKDPSLDAVKTRIMSDARLRSDFDACVTLYRDMIQQKAAQEKKSLNVSMTEMKITDDDKKKKSRKGGVISEDKVEDRYYDSKEYQKLTPEAKLKLKRMRENRGHTPKSKKQKKNPKLSKKDLRNVAKLAAAISGQRDDDQSQGSSDSETEATDNRTNSALTRQSGGRRRSGR